MDGNDPLGVAGVSEAAMASRTCAASSPPCSAGLPTPGAVSPAGGTVPFVPAERFGRVDMDAPGGLKARR